MGHSPLFASLAMTTSGGDDISIGKFDILATYTCARALLDGKPEGEAKVRGIVAAIMGAQARLGHVHGHKDEFHNDKERAERKKKSTITASMFDHQVAAKMGPFFEDVFLPGMKKLVQAGLSYDEVKQVVGIPTRWGAKISGQQFAERAAVAIKDH